MGRRVLAERIFTPSMMTVKPPGLHLFHDLPEADDSNRGHSGVQGYSEEVMHYVTRRLSIEKSGGQQPDDDEYGGRFKARLSDLRNSDGDRVMDNQLGGVLYANPLSMGAERAFVPRFAMGVTGAPAQNALGTPKIVPLERHRKGLGGVTGSPSVLAVMLFWEEDGVGSTVFDLKMSRLLTKENSTLASCQWNTTLWTLIDGSDDDDPNFTAAADFPNVDGVEMEDGTVAVVWSFEDEIRFCRLFGIDSIPGIEQVSSFSPTIYSAATTRHVCIERIGSRLVVAYSHSLTSGTNGIFVRYSDDEGYTWSSEIHIQGGGDATGTNFQPIDMVKSYDGWLYLMRIEPITNDVEVWRSLDGKTWYMNVNKSVVPGAGVNVYPGTFHGATMCQDSHGQWHLYTVNQSGSATMAYHYTCSSKDDADAPFVTNVFRDNDPSHPYMTDADCLIIGQCARALNYGGFIDVASLVKDDASGDYYSIWVHRFAMWTSRQREKDQKRIPNTNWDACWSAHAYPSTSDGHPNIGLWARTLSGASTSLIQDDDGGRLRLYRASGQSMHYSYALPDDSYDDGVQLAFEMKCHPTTAGDARIWGSMTSNANNKDFEFEILFDNSLNKIILYDRNGSVHDEYTPTNWLIQDWNYYEVLILENVMYLLRAPSGSHHEVCPMEIVVIGAGMAETTYSGQDNSISFGSGDGRYSYWRSVYLAHDDYNYIFGTDLRGRRMALRPVGLMGNEGFKFNGDFHYALDDWDVETRAIFDGENILSPSPLVAWREPTQTAGSDSPERVFQIDVGEDGNGEDVEVAVHGFGLFNRNFLDFKVEYLRAGLADTPPNWSTLFDTTGGTPLDTAYIGPLKIDTLADNIIVPEDGSEEIAWSTLLPYGMENLFSSDERKRWFIRFTGTSGGVSGNTYEIRTIDRAGRIYFHTNLEEAGASVGDPFVIFGSEFVYSKDVDENPFFVSQVKLTITSQSRPDTDDTGSMQLGTFLLGRAMDLPDEEWEFTLGTKANVSVTGSRSGVQQVRRIGPERTVISTRFTGVVDRGMGRTTPKELFRFLGGGVYPLVWIDDDSVLDNDSNGGHHNPLLVRMVGNIDQRHRTYIKVADDPEEGINQGDEIRNIMDIGGFVFEEVV